MNTTMQSGTIRDILFCVWKQQNLHLTYFLLLPHALHCFFHWLMSWLLNPFKLQCSKDYKHSSVPKRNFDNGFRVAMGSGPFEMGRHGQNLLINAPTRGGNPKSGTTKKALFWHIFFNFGHEGVPNVTKIAYERSILWKNWTRKKNCEVWGTGDWDMTF